MDKNEYGSALLSGVEGHADGVFMFLKIVKSVLRWIEKKSVRAGDDLLGIQGETLTPHADPLVGRFGPGYSPERPRTLQGATFPRPPRTTLTAREAYQRHNELLARRRTGAKHEQP